MKTVKPVMTEARKKAYLKNPGSCPVCRDTDIVGDSIEVDGSVCWQEVGCQVCGFEWTDIYKLSNVEPR